MGGCVSTVMESRNQASMVENNMITRFREYGDYSVAVPGSETGMCSATYRNGHSHTDEDYNAVLTRFREDPNVTERFIEMCKKHKDSPKIAYRPVLRRVKEMVSAGKVQRMLEVTHLDETTYITLGDFLSRIESFSRGLAELGIAERSSVAIYEETRWEWLVTIYGIWLRNLVATTVYANLGEDALIYALHEAECKAVICNGRSVPNLLRSIAAGSFPPCIIIYLDDLPPEGCEIVGDARVVSWKEVADLGANSDKPVHIPHNKDTLALIMYTSGTTGNPKGVMHTHGSIAAGVRSMEDFLDSNLPSRPDESYCAYLPLAHILEFGVVNVFLSRGALVGFGSPRTLTDVTARPHGDFAEYKPDCIVAVPRIFDTVKRAVEAKLPPVGSVKRKVFDTAYQTRLQALKDGKDTPFYNEKIFKQARAAFGSDFRLLLSGGGPLAASTQEFVNVVFGFVINGWGLTETVCVGAIQRLGDMEPACSGQVIHSEELKLLDTEEYKHTDKPEPRGELCIRGPFTFKGYYKQPELTKEVLSDDGWFRTGDIGSITSDGRVRVIGRIKALAKNVLGEYIALETLEALYSNHPIVLNNCLCIIVHPEKNYICAVAVTDAGRVHSFAKTNGIAGKTTEELLASEEFHKALDKSMVAFGVAAKKKNFELVRHIGLLTEEWTPENGALTAAMKLKRSVISERYADLIRNLFVDE